MQATSWPQVNGRQGNSVLALARAVGITIFEILIDYQFLSTLSNSDPNHDKKVRLN